MTVNYQVINLGGVSISPKANSVENKNVRIVAEETLEVKSHLRFNCTAVLANLSSDENGSSSL